MLKFKIKAVSAIHLLMVLTAFVVALTPFLVSLIDIIVWFIAGEPTGWMPTGTGIEMILSMFVRLAVSVPWFVGIVYLAQLAEKQLTKIHSRLSLEQRLQNARQGKSWS